MRDLFLQKKSRQAFTAAIEHLKKNRLLSIRKISKLVSAAALALLFFAAGFSVSKLDFSSLDFFSRLLNPATRILSFNPILPINLQRVRASHTPLFFAGHNEEKPFIPPVIVEFLKTYSLSKYDKAFFDGIRFNQFKRVAKDIYRSTGYEMIRLDNIPDFIGKTHEVLSYPLGPDRKISHFLFWRPIFRINKFYYSYKGHDIFLLQKKLAALNLYDRHADGVVDPDLLIAVVQFQNKMNLEITGYPDPRTVFLVCRLANQSDTNQKDEIAALEKNDL
jgi:hypothetical protein